MNSKINESKMNVHVNLIYYKYIIILLKKYVSTNYVKMLHF